YLLVGAAALPRLNGMFAFAIWDRRSRELVMARDGMGVKPLYIRETPRGLLFASEIKAILQEGSTPAHFNPRAVLRHLTFCWSPAPETIVEGIEKIEPGEMVTVRDGRIAARHRFYDVPVPASVPDDRSPNDLAVELRHHLETAVKRQMVSDVPVGAFLSGGLDSSSIVAVAARENGARLPCFTIAFDNDGKTGFDGFAEDLQYARQVAKHLDVDLNIVHVGVPTPDLLSDVIYHLDEPVADLAPVNVWHIAKLSRELGIKVLLGGAGGDDIFTGYRRHVALMGERYWSWLPQPARALMAATAGLLPNSNALFRRVSKAFRHAGQSADDRLIGYFNWLEPAPAHALLTRDFAAGVAPSSTAEPMQRLLARLPASASPLQKMLYLECRNFLADHNLHYTDRMTMAHGVEARVPLLDPDLVAFAAGVPDRWKQNGATGKWIFKKAMEGILPHDVIYRPKTGFGLPLRQWLHGPMQPLLDQFLSPSALKDSGLFDPAAVAKLVRDNSEGRYDAASTIWGMVSIQIWAQRNGVSL
ncbi:MAG: asparagine synthase (glutamine-hydrolyzing), partial [Beijerinckiaceae bacterium]